GPKRSRRGTTARTCELSLAPAASHTHPRLPERRPWAPPVPGSFFNSRFGVSLSPDRDVEGQLSGTDRSDLRCCWSPTLQRGSTMTNMMKSAFVGLPMLIAIGAASVIPAAAQTTTTTTEYYVVQDTKTKKCTV